jgi:hypothetical protein
MLTGTNIRNLCVLHGPIKSKEFFQMSVTKFVVIRIFSHNACNFRKNVMVFLNISLALYTVYRTMKLCSYIQN